MPGEKIGVVEDDRLLNRALCVALKKEGFSPAAAWNKKEGRELLREGCVLFLVDINLPDGDGFSLCQEIREERGTPVIFLTARDEEEDMLEAFGAGGDDYVVKPFAMRVLMKRIHAVLRRNREPENLFSYRELTIDFLKKRVRRGEREIPLTPKEYRLLELLARHKGQVLSKEQILEQVWDLDGLFVGENTVSVTINRLRKKLEFSSEEYIKNVFGQGYRLGE